MKIRKMKRYSLGCILLLAFCSSACKSSVESLVDESEFITPFVEATVVETVEKEALLATDLPAPTVLNSITVSGTIPDKLLNLIASENILIASQESSSIKLEQIESELFGKDQIKTIEWLYVLAAPFPTVSDNISFSALDQLWGSDVSADVSFQKLIIDPITFEIFAKRWGKPGKNVEIVSSDILLEIGWNLENVICILPFENLSAKWKVIELDNTSPFDSDFELTGYPLVIRYEFLYDENNSTIGIELHEQLQELPESNYSSEKVTSVLLTGVTALVRETAARIERHGVEYPASDIGFLFDQVDLLHISNEVSFYSECPSADPPRKGGRFCSSPDYLDLFTNIGVDVVELTGNHLLDYGQDAFLETLEIYTENGISYYGGGMNQEEAAEALFVEVNGNRLAFMGCNVPGPVSVFADENSPGAAKCDLDQLTEKVQILNEQGYNVIVTLQHYESCQLEPMSGQRVDFNRIAEAGAVIVSGSQAHCPQGMRFIGESFVHYGLGNLFFDQMYPDYQNEFLDEHIFYEGKYLGVVLHTAVLEDYAKPRMMVDEERMEFLEKVFGASSW